jgi:transposase-like protein
MGINDKNDTLKNKIVSLLIEYRGIIATVCQKVGISRNCFYEWCKDDSEFKELVENAKELAIDSVETKLFDLIEANDTTATIFFLKTRGKNRGYVERQEITGADGKDINPPTIDFSKMTDDDIREFLRKNKNL